MSEKRYTLAVKKESNLISLSTPTSDEIPTNESYILSYINTDLDLAGVNNKNETSILAYNENTENTENA